MSKKEHEEKEETKAPLSEKEEANAEPAGEPVTELLARYDELNDKYLRLYSDFDNYRRRTLKEIGDIRKNASEDLIVKLLPVLDDFERAIKAFGTSDNADALKEGIILIFNKFFALMSSQGLEQMKTMGEEFNTDFHEAITNIPAPSEEMKNRVIDEIEKGYLLNEKVVRFAKVVVGS